MSDNDKIMRTHISLIAFSILFTVMCLFPRATHAADAYFLAFSFLSGDSGVRLLSVKLLPGIAPRHLEQQSSNPLFTIIGNDKTVLYQTRIEVPPAVPSNVNPLGIFFSISVPYLAGMASYELIGTDKTSLLSGSILSESELVKQLVISPLPDIGLHKPDSSQFSFKNSSMIKNIIYVSIGLGILVIVILLFAWRGRIKKAKII